MKNYSSDKPIENKSDDRFQRYGFSKRIADTILNSTSSDGLVIGIYGAWGEGKTSVQNFIEHELRQDENVLIVKLNPWRYNDEETLIKNFLKKIADTLGKELDSNKEKFGSLISKYGGIGGVIGIDFSSIGKSLAEIDLESLKDRVDEFLNESTKKLVIFVDDIDRLDKNEIYSLLRLVKLTGDFRNTTYILSFDEDMVASAIGERFGSGDEKSGRNFLEKIIQVPLKIPQAQSDALKIFCFELVDKVIEENKINISEEEVQRFVSLFTHNVQLRLKTPRLAIRYGNSLAFTVPLLLGEVNTVDLMLIEAIKIFFPRHYDFIKHNPVYFTSSYSSHREVSFGQSVTEKKEELQNHLENLASDLSKNETSAILNLLKGLFPTLNEAFHNRFEHNGEKKWSKDKRIVSTSYFKRYFSYSVITGELSDVEFDEFINTLEIKTTEKLKTIIKEFLEKITPENFLFKIRMYEDDLNWNSSKNLIFGLAELGNLFTPGNSLFAFGMDGSQAQAAILIYNLLKKHDDKQEAFEVAKILMGYSVPYDFSYQINNWLRTGETEAEKIFSLDQYTELAKILKERILSECGDTPIFEKYPDNISYILTTWKLSDSDELEKYLKGIIEKNPEKIKSFLISLTPTSRSTSNPEPHKSNLEKRHYDYIVSLLDKKFIHETILHAFANELNKDVVNFEEFEDKQSDINILRQFEHWYERDIHDAEIVTD